MAVRVIPAAAVSRASFAIGRLSGYQTGSGADWPDRIFFFLSSTLRFFPPHCFMNGGWCFSVANLP